MYQPQHKSKVYYDLLHKNREAQLFLAALRLEVFSYLEDWSSPAELALRTGFNGRNLALLLNALAAAGLLEKRQNDYRNTGVGNEFLHKNSPVYLGESLLFRERMMALDNVEERVRSGPDAGIAARNQGVEVYNFHEAARCGIPEMYTGRVQGLLKAVQKLFGEEQPRKVLDLGGGSGVMLKELVSHYPNSRGVLFEHPSVADLPRQLLREWGLADRISILAGDFNKDDIGKDYDLIIASGIIDFAKDHLDILTAKLGEALAPEGYLYLVSHNVNEDYQEPAECILGWLSSHLDGLDILLTKDTIVAALARHGFKPVLFSPDEGVFTFLQGEFYQRRLDG
ncbi:class I SAM-dependent methyltransferase [Desulfitobacterium hafniense]|uniref:class I SAM-dependent methyltransferase n=1 Tax=Desulfitobacterium hafniense TaxID=49338 RepID=UPI0006837451|nr:methyltransferase [Desulfitobacterium hafniense]